MAHGTRMIASLACGRRLTMAGPENPRVGTGNRGGRAGRAARLLVMVVAVCLAVASCGGGAARRAGALRVKSCTVAGRHARCGTLIVPEDRLTGKGRTISVRFVVLPAMSPDRAPDPVVYFAGGPGDSAVASIAGEQPLLRDLNVRRDLVFIDQRGTGGSNPLACPGIPGTLGDKQALHHSIESCLAHLRGDLRFYTTAMYADDVNQVLAALHYPRVNLFGGSYGATAEQVFLLRHPSRVRTMTLLSGTLLTIPLFERFPRNAQRALGYVFTACERDRPCHRAFPQLAADWARLWASLATPWVIPGAQSPTGEPLRVGQDTIATKIHESLVNGNLAPIPLVVHTLGTAKNKAAALASMVKASGESGESGQASPSSSPAPMIPYPIRCGEPWASYRPQALAGQRASFEYRTDLLTARWWHYVCPLIPRSPAAVGQQQLTVSHVPVLAFNGQADPQDPPQNMTGAHTFWPNSRVLAVPGQGHGISTAVWETCLGPLTQTFINQGSVARLDASCLASVPTPPFDLTLHDITPGG